MASARTIAAVGEHQLDGAHVVDREPVLAHEPPDAARRGEAADADPAVVARGQRPAVRREERGDVLPAGARADAHEPCRLVEHLHRVEPAEVDDDAAVVRRSSADAVAAAADAERHGGVRAGEGDRLGDLLRVAGPEHEPGRPAPHVGGLHPGVAGVAGLDRVRRERHGQRVVVDAGAALRADRAAATDPCRLGDGRGIRVPELACDRLAECRRDLGGEVLHRAGVVAREDERADAVVDHERQQLLDPLLGRAVEESAAGRREPAADVDESPDLARVASGRECGLVDRAVARGELAGLQVGEGGQPPVALAADEPQHPRLEGADPDGDVVRRRGPALRAVDAVVLAVDLEPGALALVPDAADDVDRLGEGVDGLAGGEASAAHGVDRIPEAAGAEAEVESPAAEQVEARGRAREHRRRTQRHVGDVGREVHAFGARRDPGQQGRRVVEARLVGVVLERDEVVSGCLGELGEAHGRLRRIVRRGDEGAELQLVAVVHSAPIGSCGSAHGAGA